jgi:hypothetical protein
VIKIIKMLKEYPKTKNISRYLRHSVIKSNIETLLVPKILMVADKGSIIPNTIYDTEKMVALRKIIKDKFL